MVFSIITMLLCVALICLTAFILYHALKEIEIIERNINDLHLRLEEIEEKKE